MTRAARLSCALTLMAVTATCGGNGKSAGFIQRYAGDPYMGTLSVRIFEPDNSRGGSTKSGTGSAQFIDRGNGKARLVVAGNLRAPGDAGFVIDGIDIAQGWRGQTDGLQLAVGKDGAISGGGTANLHRLQFDGSVVPEGFDLKVELQMLEKNGKGLPAGTRFVFNYRLRRAVASSSEVKQTAKADGGRRAGNADCKRIIWQVRNIADFSGGMQMISVPQCVQW